MNLTIITNTYKLECNYSGNILESYNNLLRDILNNITILYNLIPVDKITFTLIDSTKFDLEFKFQDGRKWKQSVDFISGINNPTLSVDISLNLYLLTEIDAIRLVRTRLLNLRELHLITTFTYKVN